MNYRKLISKTLIGALITGIALFPSNTATAAGYSQPKLHHTYFLNQHLRHLSPKSTI